MKSAKKIFAKSITVGRTLLLRARSHLLFGVFLAGGFIQAASAQTPYGVSVSVGYLNNIDLPGPNPATIPDPFQMDPNTQLISSGPATTRHDTGVILFENWGEFRVYIEKGLTVTTERGVFRIWDDSLPATLEPAKRLVLAETGNPENGDFNFDTSEGGLGSNPVVTGSVSGDMAETTPFRFDGPATRVLLGHEDMTSSAETTPYQSLGPATPELREIKGPGLVIKSATCESITFWNLGTEPESFQIVRATFGPEGQPALPIEFSPASANVNPGGMETVTFTHPGCEHGASPFCHLNVDVHYSIDPEGINSSQGATCE